MICFKEILWLCLNVSENIVFVGTWMYEVECMALVYITKHLQQTRLQLLYFNKGVKCDVSSTSVKCKYFFPTWLSVQVPIANVK